MLKPATMSKDYSMNIPHEKNNVCTEKRVNEMDLFYKLLKGNK